MQMNSARNRWENKFLAMSLALALIGSSLPAQQQADYTFRVQTDLILVNVTVRDKNGNFVRGLKPQDFTILEDNKPQKIVSFDVEDVDAVANQSVAQTKPLTGVPAEPSTPGSAPSAADSANQFKDRRLIVLFFRSDAVANQSVAQTKPLTGVPAEPSTPGSAPSAADSANQFKDRRLIVLFF